MRRFLAPLGLFLALSLLSGCVNSWKAGYVAATSAAPIAHNPGTVEIRGLPGEDVLKAPPPAGEERIGYSEFVSSAGPEMDRLQEFAREIGADTVIWGRSFASLSQETDYRADFYPGDTTTTTVTGPNGTTTVRSTSRGQDYVPYTRTDAWYRYVAVFYRSK